LPAVREPVDQRCGERGLLMRLRSQQTRSGALLLIGVHQQNARPADWTSTLRAAAFGHPLVRPAKSPEDGS
jgi:hypothetical protein